MTEIEPSTAPDCYGPFCFDPTAEPDAGCSVCPHNQAEPQVSYFETTSKTIVRVVRIEGRVAHLDDGTTAWMRDLYHPRWLVRAEAQLVDAQDERETCALDVGVQ